MCARTALRFALDKERGVLTRRGFDDLTRTGLKLRGEHGEGVATRPELNLCREHGEVVV